MYKLNFSLIVALLLSACSVGPERVVASGQSAPRPQPIAQYTSAPVHSSKLAASITVSGTVTGPGGIVPNVWIGAGSPLDWQEASTNASGFYSLSIQTDGSLWFHVRPDPAMRLTQANHWLGNVSGSFTQNFTVTQGYLLSVQPTVGGVPLAEQELEVLPLEHILHGEWWHSLDWDESTQHFRAVLPPDVYYVTARHVPAGYYDTTRAYDLRSADLTITLPLSTTYVHPIPYDPPDATKITIGSPDDLGEATVTGAAGAALPLAHVLLVNLNSNHQVDAISGSEGSFSARIFAPPGSALLIKHGPASHRWDGLDTGLAEGVNPFPGTIINVPHTHAGDTHNQPFAAAGGIAISTDDANATRNTVGAAWAISGTIGPVVVDGQWTRILTGTYDNTMIPGLYLGGLNWTHPALADLDNDTDLDLIVGERSGHLVFYRNVGTANAPDWKFITDDYANVNTGGWAYPALVDVTNDGAPDLFVGEGNGSVAIYYNDGTPAAPLWPATPDVTLAAGNNAAPALDDLDGDGKLDLLVGHAGGALYHFKNTGTLTNPTWTQQSAAYAGINEAGEGLQPAFVDLDGDGDRDLLVGLCGQLIWYQRGGTSNLPTWTRVGSDPIGYGGGSCASSPGVGNWDGDGDEDIVTGEHWGNLRFFRNDGSPTWTELGFSFPFELAGDSAPALADWDNDGDPDLLIGQAHGQVQQYTNIGTAAHPNWQPNGELLTLPWTNHPHPFPALGDIDGDGKPELFIGEGSWDGPEAGGNIRYYHNDGTLSSPAWTLVTTHYQSLDVGGWSTPALADIDDDNDLDLFIGDAAGTLTFVQNTGTVTSPTWAAPVQPYADLNVGDYSAPSFFDVDDDGDLDMLIGTESGSLAYVRNTGAASSPSWKLISTQYPGIDVGERAIPAAADADGNGKPDLFLGDGDGGLNLYRYDGPGAPPTSGNSYAPGDLFQIEAELQLYSYAITATTPISNIQANSGAYLLMLYNQAGRALAAENYFMSTLLTPSGFPIQRVEHPIEGMGVYVYMDNLHYAGGHTIAGDLHVSGQWPDDLPPGIYRPVIGFDFTGVPTSTQWLASNVVRHTFSANEAPLPPITIQPTNQLTNHSTNQLTTPPSPLIWRLLMDDFVQGTRGAGAREDESTFGLASQIVFQGAPYYIPPIDERTGQAITYRLEPFLPMISFTDRRLPTPPLIPFELPGGQLHVAIHQPNGSVLDLGSEAFAQSFNRTKTTRSGGDLNSGTVQLEDVYSLKAASDRFRVTFDQYGHHVITMTGVISDLWGNTYTGGGTYDVWVAHPLDIEPGVLPGTPLAVGDAFNPSLQFYPRVPASVNLVITHYPDSDPTQAISYTITGRANDYGYFGATDVVSFTHHGEYRVDLSAVYTDASGKLYMGSMTWGSVVMTPPGDAELIAHGRRGLDSLPSIPNHWYVSKNLPIPAGAVSHSLNPYYNGDIFWSRMSDGPYGGDSLVLGASVQDTVGTIEAAIQARANRVYPPLAAPGDLTERISKNELPLFISTLSGQAAQTILGQIGPALPSDIDQIAYSYRSSQRPGVRVRELVAEDGQSGGYWRLDTLYDDQLSVGVLGDQPNDFKFQYVGAVYRDLESGHNEYAGQGSGWVFIPDSDTTGSRVMPPFAGPGNGGWTTEGGPILTLKGQDIHIFILPTGVLPGAVLEVGDTFLFAGHIMPTLNSQVAVTITAPSGALHTGGGQANSIGYFYNPDDDLSVNEPGLWSVDVRVWHQGQCSGGTTIPPYPSGDVLGSLKAAGSANGRYWFYVVPSDAQRLAVSSPSPGFLSFNHQITPITITGSIPPGLSGVWVDYTISMPGYILEHGQATLNGDTYQIVFDPVALAQDFPNLDLAGRDDQEAGLADTFAIGLLLRGQSGGQTIYSANTITLQGEQVFIRKADSNLTNKLYLPLILKGG